MTNPPRVPAVAGRDRTSRERGRLRAKGVNVPERIPTDRRRGSGSVGGDRRCVREVRGRPPPGRRAGVPNAARVRPLTGLGRVRHEFVVARRVGRAVLRTRGRLLLATRTIGCLVVTTLTAALARLRRCGRSGDRSRRGFAGSLDEPTRTVAGPGDRNGHQERHRQCPRQGRPEHHIRPQEGRGTGAAQSARPPHSSAPRPPSLYREWP